VVTFLGISSLFSIFFYWQIRREILGKAPLPKEVSLDVAYGRRVTVQKFVYTLSESLPPLAVSFVLGHAALAGFQVAIVFLTGVSGLIGALAVISLPHFFRDTASQHRLVFWQNVVIGLVASVCYLIVVSIVFLPLYGQGYRESFALAQMLAGLPIIISLRTFLVNYYTARDKNNLIIGVYLVANAIAMSVFLFVGRHAAFVSSVSAYLYTLQVLLFIPLLYLYFSRGNSTADAHKN
jgi:O-antigen/teichoic acid export membrane protein